MTTLKLMAFSLRHLAALGYWQAGAEMYGGDTRRARADAHRQLQMLASGALHQQVRPRAVQTLRSVKTEG